TDPSGPGPGADGLGACAFGNRFSISDLPDTPDVERELGVLTSDPCGTDRAVVAVPTGDAHEHLPDGEGGQGGGVDGEPAGGPTRGYEPTQRVLVGPAQLLHPGSERFIEAGGVPVYHQRLMP